MGAHGIRLRGARSRRLRCLGGLVLALAVAAVALGAGSASACGCGMLLRASAVSEKALVSYTGHREVIVPGLTIDRVSGGAALVFPVPGRPTLRQLPARLHLFGELEAATAPPPRSETGGGGARHGAGKGGARPRVISHQLLGGYAITVLRGGSGHALLAWLRAHRYRLPRGAAPILSSYSTDGWYFVAIRLASRSAGEIRPLAISFHSRRIVYPMRLSRLAAEPVRLELFVDSPGRVSASGIPGVRTRFAASVASVARRLSPAVRSLLPEPYLTRFSLPAVRPSSIRSDLTIMPALAY